MSHQIIFQRASLVNLQQINNLAINYAKDFSEYNFQKLILKERVYVYILDKQVIGFATYGLNKYNPESCYTSSARHPDITRDILSGDFMRKS